MGAGEAPADAPPDPGPDPAPPEPLSAGPDRPPEGGGIVPTWAPGPAGGPDWTAIPRRAVVRGRAAVSGWWWRAPLADRAVVIATWLLVAVGAGLRVRQWAIGRSFWLDELLLLRAMGEQRFSQLLEPLSLSQSAPPGWLAVQHVMVGLSGSDERAARLVPLLLGIGGLVVVVPLARLLLGGPAQVAATALVALSPPLIGYSDEFKQYSSDVFWVPLVLLVGCRLALRHERRRRDWAALAGTTAAVVWFSHAGTLVAAGVFGALGVLTLARRRRDLPVLLGCAVPWAAGLAVEYATLLSRNTDDAVLQAYWVNVFPPPGPVTGDVALDWLVRRATSVAANPLGLAYGWALLLLVLAGLLVLARRRPAALPVLLLPVLVVAAAGLAGSYPIANRLALWLVPVVALVLAAALDLPAAAAPDLRRIRLPAAPPAAAVAVALTVAGLTVAALATLVVLARPQVTTTVRYAQQPRAQEDGRTVLETVAAERRPDDLVLVDRRGAWPTVAFYGPRLGLGPVQALQVVRPAPACRVDPLGRQLRLGPYARIWLFSSHTRPRDLQIYRAQLEPFGRTVRTVETYGARADLLERLPGPVPPPGRDLRSCASIVPLP